MQNENILIDKLLAFDRKSISRCISLAENDDTKVSYLIKNRRPKILLKCENKKIYSNWHAIFHIFTNLIVTDGPTINSSVVDLDFVQKIE